MTEKTNKVAKVETKDETYWAIPLNKNFGKFLCFLCLSIFLFILVLMSQNEVEIGYRYFILFLSGIVFNYAGTIPILRRIGDEKHEL